MDAILTVPILLRLPLIVKLNINQIKAIMWNY